MHGVTHHNPAAVWLLLQCLPAENSTISPLQQHYYRVSPDSLECKVVSAGDQVQHGAGPEVGEISAVHHEVVDVDVVVIVVVVVVVVVVIVVIVVAD